MLLIGTSGWRYWDWKGVFYPAGLPSAEMLAYYAERFPTTEVNDTFYHFTRQKTIAGWLSAVPESFVFSVKLHRYITHECGLRPPAEIIERARAVIGGFGKRLGSLLVQLPPGFRKDYAALRHAMKWLGDLPVAFEFRNATWFEDPDLEKRVNNAGAVVVSVDSPRFRTPIFRAGPFVYVRLHGRTRMFRSSYTPEELSQLAAALPRNRRVFVYFNNTVKGVAALNALELLRLAPG